LETTEDIFGILVEDEKAMKKRSNKMKTGTKRSIKGGGGRGGITNGRININKAKITKIKAEYLGPETILVIRF
jgi:hypothetical protein